MTNTNRLARGIDTFKTMIRIYCRGHHGHSVCKECAELLACVTERLNACPFGNDKPVCGKCAENCFDLENRRQMQTVMRYAGPRMLLRHPIRAALHIIEAVSKRSPSQT